MDKVKFPMGIVFKQKLQADSRGAATNWEWSSNQIELKNGILIDNETALRFLERSITI